MGKNPISYIPTPKEVQSTVVGFSLFFAVFYQFLTSGSHFYLKLYSFLQFLPQAFFLYSISQGRHLVIPFLEHDNPENFSPCSVPVFRCVWRGLWCLLMSLWCFTHLEALYPIFPIPVSLTYFCSKVRAQILFICSNSDFRHLPFCLGSDLRLFSFPLWFILLCHPFNPQLHGDPPHLRWGALSSLSASTHQAMCIP